MNSYRDDETTPEDLTPAEILDWLRAFGVEIEVVDLPNGESRLRLTSPAGFAIPDEIQAAITRQKPQLLDLLRGHPVDARAPVPIRPDVDHQTGGEPQPSLPAIDAGNHNLADVARQAWEAFAAANDPPTYFRHGNALVRLEMDDADRPLLVPLIHDRLRHKLARSASWYRETKQGIVDALPPRHVAMDMLATPQPPLPPLVRIVDTPVFAATGALIATPGYDAGSGIYYAPGLVVPPVPTAPTVAEIAQARELILEVVSDFPFVADAERANAIAVLFEQPAREMIAGPLPLHAIEAPDAGTGKGLLAAALLLPFTGDRVGVIAEAQTDDEWRKRLTAALRALAPAILIDNLRRTLDSPVVASVLTASYWDDRLLGTNDLLHLPVRCSWLMTANNPTLSREIARRVVRTRLDARVDRPWEREGFRHTNLLAWVRERRGEIVAAVLTLVQAWVAAGKPEGTVSLGSYERWAAVVGGILDTASIAGFLGNLDAVYEATDGEGEAWRRLIGAWWETHRDTAVSAGDLFALAAALEGFDFGKGDERAQKISFGKQLAKQRDRVIGEYRVTLTGTHKRINQWQLVFSPSPSPPPAEPDPGRCMSPDGHAPPDSPDIQAETEVTVHVGACFSTDLACENPPIASQRDVETDGKHAPTCTTGPISGAIAGESDGACPEGDMHRQGDGAREAVGQSGPNRAAAPSRRKIRL